MKTIEQLTESVLLEQSKETYDTSWRKEPADTQETKKPKYNIEEAIKLIEKYFKSISDWDVKHDSYPKRPDEAFDSLPYGQDEANEMAKVIGDNVSRPYWGLETRPYAESESIRKRWKGTKADLLGDFHSSQGTLKPSTDDNSPIKDDELPPVPALPKGHDEEIGHVRDPRNNW